MDKFQTLLRFVMPCGDMSSSQWRQKLKSSKNLEGVDLDQFAIFQSSTAFSITAMQPEASGVIHERVMDFMRATANAAGKTLDVEKLDLHPTLATTDFRWSYNVPRFVVARPAKNPGTENPLKTWDRWKDVSLSDAAKDEMSARLNHDLTKQVQIWLDDCPELDLTIDDYGHPMILSNAIANGPKSVSVMSRLNVTFSSSRRLEGAFYVGMFNVLGFGRIFRNGFHEKV